MYDSFLNLWLLSTITSDSTSDEEGGGSIDQAQGNFTEKREKVKLRKTSCPRDDKNLNTYTPKVPKEQRSPTTTHYAPTGEGPTVASIQHTTTSNSSLLLQSDQIIQGLLSRMQGLEEQIKNMAAAGVQKNCLLQQQSVSDTTTSTSLLRQEQHIGIADILAHRSIPDGLEGRLAPILPQVSLYQMLRNSGTQSRTTNIFDVMKSQSEAALLLGYFGAK